MANRGLGAHTPASKPEPPENRDGACAGKARPGARQRKHVPQRTCVACRRTAAKRELIRIVRTPEGTIEIDPKGKRAGRGAYLCNQEECWDTALRQGVLGRALKVPVTKEQITELWAQARGVVEPGRDPSVGPG